MAAAMLWNRSVWSTPFRLTSRARTVERLADEGGLHARDAIHESQFAAGGKGRCTDSRASYVMVASSSPPPWPSGWRTWRRDLVILACHTSRSPVIIMALSSQQLFLIHQSAQLRATGSAMRADTRRSRAGMKRPPAGAAADRTSHHTRTKRTTDKTRHGGLPAPFDATMWGGLGSGKPCSGCVEPIERTEREFEKDLLEGLTLRFHAECYAAWMSFERKTVAG